MIGFITYCVLLAVFVTGVDAPSQFNWINDLPGVDNIRRAGYYAAFIAALAVVGFTSRNGKSVLLPFSAYVLAIALLAWTGSRGAAVAVVGALAMGFVLVPMLRSWRRAGPDSNADKHACSRIRRAA